MGRMSQLQPENAEAEDFTGGVIAASCCPDTLRAAVPFSINMMNCKAAWKNGVLDCLDCSLCLWELVFCPHIQFPPAWQP